MDDHTENPNENPAVDFTLLKTKIDATPFPVKSGRVTRVFDLVVEATLPGARIGSRGVALTREGHRVPFEVAWAAGLDVKLLPLADMSGVGPGDRVVASGEKDHIWCGPGMIGRIIDATGMAVDGKGPLENVAPWDVARTAPNPLTRAPVDSQLITGVRAIDGCLALGEGQRVGLLAGPGLGKSTLLGMLARRSHADVSVICLVGERGREVREFPDNQLGAAGRAKAVAVLATADAPPQLRVRALNVATAIAEWFRAGKKRVLLLVDSLTRVVRAKRDVALALGEAPVRGGFPGAAFAALPSLLERAGCDAAGSITAFYAVLTEADDGDVVAEEVRSLVDGHIVLSAKLAGAGRWPAIDVVRSVSRVMEGVVSRDHMAAAARFRRILGAYEVNEDLVLMGAYREGTCPDTDLALACRNEIESFLRQSKEEHTALADTRDMLSGIGVIR